MSLYIRYGDEDGPTFERKCRCGRIVKADDSIRVNGLDEVDMESDNATCSRCGRTKMGFVGYI